MQRSLYEAFCSTASRLDHREAWILTEDRSMRSIRWSEFRDQVDRLALWLSNGGLNAGDRVVNLEPNSHRWAILDLACAAIGAVHSPIDPRWHDRQIQRAIASLEPKAVFSLGQSNPTHTRGLSVPSMPIAQALDQATCVPSVAQRRSWQEIQRDLQLANILWTSGTSANPKGVMLSHGNLLSNAMAKLDAMPQDDQDLRLNLLPFAHAYARTCELTAWYLSGGTMACATSSQTLIELAQLLGPTLVNAVPSVYEYWIKQARVQSHAGEQCNLRTFLGGRIRQLASGGAAIKDSVRECFESQMLTIFQGYGLTEASPVVCSNRAARQEGGQTVPAILQGVGPPVQGVKVRIDSDQKLWVQGPGVMQGYWRDEFASQQRIQSGWLDTGDCVSIGNLAHGSIRISGRADDIQVLNTGYKFAPRILEEPIEQIESIAGCVVVGNGLRRPVAIVSLKGDSWADPESLLSEIRALHKDQPEHLEIAQVVVVKEPWTIENGLRHWKGGVNRNEIVRKFAPP
ncbi:MAG: AMP-binding protein [Planctomycetota bacterium]